MTHAGGHRAESCHFVMFRMQKRLKLLLKIRSNAECLDDVPFPVPYNRILTRLTYPWSSIWKGMLFSMCISQDFV